MTDNNSYRPHLPNDATYLKWVADLLETQDQSDISFELLSELTQELWFANPYESITINNLNTQSIGALFNEIYTRIANDEISEPTRAKLYKLWDYLSEADNLESADIIFVFWGPSGPQRAQEAVRLYNEKFAKTILFTGQKSSFMKDIDVTEAEFYRQIALKSGVPDTDILIEEQAINTPENAVNSLSLLRWIDRIPKSVIGITLNYHMRRAALTFKAASNDEITLIRHPVSPAGFERDKYYQNKEFFQYVFYEYIKMYWARLMWHF